MMRENSTITIKRIAETLDRHPRTIEMAVQKLKKLGEFVHEGPDNNGEWKVLK